MARYRKNRKKKGEPRLSAKGRIKDEVIIDVNDVYKSFRVYFDKGSMLKETFVNPGRSRYENREILKGVSFQIRRGETVALIGQNGCGKSTTLKMLTKILYPNAGNITVNGKVSSLIELGAGFHPDMSGRENIYINASILGIKEKEVEKRIDEIIRFSELEEYIDNPIRTYSSGMYMRLAFSVAINVDADILLIDEILAVGDQSFQEKCINKLDELRKSGVTVVLVSHSMSQVEAIADRCIWIDDGKVAMDGRTNSVCRSYEDEMERRRTRRDATEDEQRLNDGQKNNDQENIAEAAESKDEFEKERRIIAERPECEAQKKSFSEKWKSTGTHGLSAIASVAIAFVMLCHAMEDIYGTSIDAIAEMTFKMKLGGFTLFAVGRSGIPLLLILVGYRLLVDEYTTVDRWRRYYQKIFIPLFLTWEIWVFGYQWFLTWFMKTPFDIKNWLCQAVFIEYTPLSNEWFGRIFFLLLLILPIVANIIHMFQPEIFRIILIVGWMLLFLFPGLDLYGQANGGTAVFSGSIGTLCYLIYMCMGYLFSLYIRRLMRGSKEVIIIILLLAGTVASQIFLNLRNVNYLLWYTYYLVSLMALLEFDIVARMKFSDRMTSLFDRVCLLIPGMYMIHKPVQMILKRYFFARFYGLFLFRTIALWGASLFLSYVIIMTISKIPVVGNIVTCNKVMKQLRDK